jgi:hypothetical protein
MDCFHPVLLADEEQPGQCPDLQKLVLEVLQAVVFQQQVAAQLLVLQLLVLPLFWQLSLLA